MAAWPPETLSLIDTADDLHVAPRRPNGPTGTPTWIWSVVVGGRIYVRAYNGIRSSWYASAAETHEGIVVAAGEQRPVTFEVIGTADEQLLTRVDDAYRVKYAGSPYLGAMVGPRARQATVHVAPKPGPGVVS